MSSKTKFQQQILFEDQDIISTSDKHLPSEGQVVFDNEQWTPLDEKPDFDSTILTEKKRPKWLWRIIFSTLTVLVGIELVDFFTLGFVESPITTSLYAIILTSVGLIAGGVVFKEFVGLRQLKKQELLREKIVGVATGASPHDQSDALSLCEQITKNLPCDIFDVQEQQWRDAIAKEHTEQELLTLYSRIVLNEVDKKALAEVAKYSSESVVLIALSPIALLDMLIMLWRNLTLIDKIAGLYGLKLGYWSRIRLLKQVVMNIVYAGASEILAEVGSDMLGAEMLGKLSGRLAQGLGAGLLTARLGLKAIHLCRPMPFDDNAPRLREVRTEIFNQVKRLVKDKK